LPSVWDETRVLPGSKIGDLAVLARRRGGEWFVGAVNGGPARAYPLDLSFLAGLKWDATVIADGADSPLAVRGWHEAVTPAGRLNLKMLSGGGFVVRLQPGAP